MVSQQCIRGGIGKSAMFRALFRKSWRRRFVSQKPSSNFLDMRQQVLLQWGRPKIEVNFDALQPQEKLNLETLQHVAECSDVDVSVNQAKLLALQMKLDSIEDPDARTYNQICQVWVNVINYRIQKSEYRLDEIQKSVEKLTSYSSTQFLKAELLQLQAHAVVLSVMDAMEPCESSGKFFLPDDWNSAAIFETVEDCIERESIPIFESLGYVRDVLSCYDFLISFYKLWRSIESTDIFDEKYVNLKLKQVQEKRHGFAKLMESRDIEDSDFEDDSHHPKDTAEAKLPKETVSAAHVNGHDYSVQSAQSLLKTASQFKVPNYSQTSIPKALPFAQKYPAEAFQSAHSTLGKATNAYNDTKNKEIRRWGMVSLIWAFLIPLVAMKYIYYRRNLEKNKPEEYPTYKRRTRPSA